MIRLKRISFLAFAVVFASLVGAKTTALAMEEVGTFRSAVIRAGASAYLEKRVDSTLCRLTLEEKVGQMMEVVIDVVGTTNAQGLFEIDSNKLDSLFSLYKVGSLLNAPGTVAPTARQWESYMAKIQEASMRILGIPCIFGLDQNHGSTYIQGGTLFPQNINVAATFNRDLARRLRLRLMRHVLSVFHGRIVLLSILDVTRAGLVCMRISAKTVCLMLLWDVRWCWASKERIRIA